MPKRPSQFERRVARIRELRATAPAAAALELRPLLGDREPFVAGFAAEAIAELGLRDCIPELAAALARTIADEQPDTGCMASEKISRALGALEADEPDVFRLGLRYLRPERAGPGEPIDRAVPVRIECAFALARSVSTRALLDLTPLLADPERDVRAGVARAIAALPGDGPAAVLHLKLLGGDSEPEVLGACMAGLLAFDSRRYLPIVEGHLAGEAAAEAAAIALGESRDAGALAVLQRGLEGRRTGRITTAILLGAALLRLPEGTAWLFELVDQAPDELAGQALRALGLHRHAPGVDARARAAVAARGSRKLVEALAEAFGAEGY